MKFSIAQTLIIIMRIMMMVFIHCQALMNSMRDLFGEFNWSDNDDCEDVFDDDDDHSLPHLNSFSDHHGVSISLDAAVDCFMELFLIDHRVQVTNMII